MYSALHNYFITIPKWKKKLLLNIIFFKKKILSMKSWKERSMVWNIKDYGKDFCLKYFLFEDILK
jgi:hypothetical protein